MPFYIEIHRFVVFLFLFFKLTHSFIYSPKKYCLHCLAPWWMPC